ncbi:MAG: hypothetical protein WCH01_21615 [Methylococcaceae bacterium]
MRFAKWRRAWMVWSWWRRWLIRFMGHNVDSDFVRGGGFDGLGGGCGGSGCTGSWLIAGLYYCLLISKQE